MKQILTFLFAAVSAACFAQGGNLQFNQVLNFNYSASLSGTNNQVVVDNLVVPSDKVWKITSASSKTNVGSGNSFDDSAIEVDNHVLFSHRYIANSQSSIMNTPYWLGSDSNHPVSLRLLMNNTGVVYGSLSIIEFNVIP
jgi:hypothetical protein